MALILVSTSTGCRTFTENGEQHMELAGREVSALAPEPGKQCLAVVDKREIWRRAEGGSWSCVTEVDHPLQSLLSVKGAIFAGGLDQAAITRIPAEGSPERLQGFDETPKRDEWFGNGPPLGVRSLTATADGAAILAAVHVGGIPRSSDRGETWSPTIPIDFDVHEVIAHSTKPNLVAAATAVGLCTSDDGGRNWSVLSERLEEKSLLAVAALPDEVLFSVQDGPFAKRSQVWRWRIGSEGVEQVRDGLPEWLDGRVDTSHIAVGAGRAAVLDEGGNLWFSRENAAGWKSIACNLTHSPALVLV